MVFEKYETWNFERPGPADVFPAAWSFWNQRGYQLESLSGSAFRGRSFHSKLGIHRVVEVTVVPNSQGTTVQIHFRADVRADVAAGGVVVAVLLLPVAVVGAAVSWHEYERDWSQERWDFWNALTAQAKAQPVAGSVPPPPPSSPLFGPSPSAAPPAATPPPPPPPAPADTASTPGVPAERCPSCQTPSSGEGKFCATCGAPMGGK